MNYEQIHFSALTPAEWRANHTFAPEVRTVLDSLRNYGWLAPLVVWGDGILVDGVTRWWLAQSDKVILARDEGMVPVVRLDGDEIDAMLAHVRMNRGRGELIPRSMSLLIRSVMASGKFDALTLQKELRMPLEEISILLDGTLFKVKKIKEFDYSKAWIPVESNGVGVPVFERPPNSDA